jgi:hypothetical protein
LLTHLRSIDEPGLWRFALAALLLCRSDGWPHADRACCSIASCRSCGRSSHRLAAIVDDTVRAGAKSAFALVCLSAFYPILLSTVFGVRSVDPRRGSSMLGCRGNA